jgi:hypothetical protein
MSSEPIQALTGIRDGIYEIRRQVEALRPTLATAATDTINIARQELCGALARRLEIAESEVGQLLEMMGLDRSG